MKYSPTLAAVACTLLTFGSIPHASAASLILGAGWSSDTINATSADSLSSPYLLTFTSPAVFSVTDAFVVGDTFFVYNFGSLILTTSVAAGTPFTPSDALADNAWESGAYSIGSVLLPAGNHSITIQGDGGGGVPAGFYARVDAAVPEPGSSAVLLTIALAGISVASRKSRK
jgi:hypothetical protein